MPPTPIDDLVSLVGVSGGPSSSSSTVTIPSTENILNTLQQRHRSAPPDERPCAWVGHSTLLLVHPQRALELNSDSGARQYQEQVVDDGSVPADGDHVESTTLSTPLPPHPYSIAGRAFASMQRSGTSQAVVFSGVSGSGKSYACSLVLSQLLRIAQAQPAPASPLPHLKKLPKLCQQIHAADTLLSAFTCAKTATTPNASRSGRILELHYSSAYANKKDDSAHSPRVLYGAKLLTFAFDASRLSIPLGKEERSFHVFYQFLAGATASERQAYRLPADASHYELLASSACFTLPRGHDAGQSGSDEMSFADLRAAFDILGIKAKHVEMIFKLISAILLLGNIHFTSLEAAHESNQETVSVSAESMQAFGDAASLLGLNPEDLERALVNKTAYVRKEVVCTLLDQHGATRQRDSLMASLYAILCSYVVESANHRIYPGDDQIKKMQPEAGAASIILLDTPGFQTKSPSGGMAFASGLGDSTSSNTGAGRRQTLIDAYGEDGYEQFTQNCSAELLQHWLNRRAFNDDSHDFVKRAVADGIKLPEVDVLDTSAMTLELLRGGAIGSRADSKLGGVLGGLAKTCSNLRKGKLSTIKEADAAFSDGIEERFRAHSQFLGRMNTGSGTSFGIKHYAGTVSYSTKHFVENDSDMFDSEFVRLFRTFSTETFLAKLFSGPCLAAESHPRDQSVVVAAQVSSQPLRHLSPLKVSRSASTSVSSDPPEPEIQPISTQLNDTLTDILAVLNEVPVWSVACIRPNDDGNPSRFDVRRVKDQIEGIELRNMLSRKRVLYAESFEYAQFAKRYKTMGFEVDGAVSAEMVTDFLTGRGLTKGKDYEVGKAYVWLSFSAWMKLEQPLRKAEVDKLREGEARQRALNVANARKSLEAKSTAASSDGATSPVSGQRGLSQTLAATASRDTLVPGVDGDAFKAGYENESSDNLLKNATPHAGAGMYGDIPVPTIPYDAGYAHPNANYMRQSQMSFANSMHAPNTPGANDVWGPEWKNANNVEKSPASPNFPISTNGAGGKDGKAKGAAKNGGKDKHATTVEEVPTSGARRAWLILVWAFTWWIPSFMLTYIGRMKRPDVRIAWREKVTLCMLIFLCCGSLLFLILGLGQVLCPQFDKAWNIKELSYHQGRTDYWVGVAGQAYDLTNFYKSQHSDIQGMDVNTDDMLELGGKDLTNYFPVPLTLGCPGLINNNRVVLQSANFTPIVSTAMHVSGQTQSVSSSALFHPDWYTANFMPKMQKYHKGPLVYTMGDLAKGADDKRIWAMYRQKVYDISDYVYTVNTMNDDNTYQFLPTTVTDLFQQSPGTDITSELDALPAESLSDDQKAQTLNCLNNVFYRGDFDFRVTPRCTVQSWFLLAFSIVLIVTIAAKFVAALQITKKRNPELQDKFIICQVPCYTEGEDSLKRTIDSLANLKYDDKRKLLFVICDGMIVGSGNDRPTPRIVLDILGVENLDPDPLLFKSLGNGNRQLNYAKVYSGLYEFEGHVLPFLVVVKVGKPSERSKPGNRGKRDSQILLMRFLNRVHLDSEMSPLELEIYHQIKNVIGVDPKLYEFLLTVDADTEVKPDSLNRLVAVAADDSSIIGLCGETKLSNEQESWWTMIQVYEYYISHHLAKAFESLFGSVTCLPGCFTLFRLRTADKGRPLLISNLVIDDYAENDVDTLHKKNLLHLGEDRYLTTLILKHFPTFKTKFTPDARAMTAAPERWNILLSQRRRWINSTIHNLFELVALKDLCGFCCFSMRFIVFIDLLGTIMLPATTVYLVYLIVTVATKAASPPLISLIMLGAVYGLQAIIFLLKRQWQFIGWLVIYILAYPVYSFFLPLYSFWHFDDFSWGNTRVVVGEGKNKKILAGDDDHYDDSMIPLRKFSDYQRAAWDTQTKFGHSPQRSEAGFSLAPPAHRQSPQGSVAGGYTHSRNGSRPATLMNYPAGPQPVFSPFSQGNPGAYSRAGSAVGSDHGGYQQPVNPYRASQMSFNPYMQSQSALGMPSQPYATPGTMTARNSSYTLSNWVAPQHAATYAAAPGNPFADPSQNPTAVAVDPTNPTDAELLTALRQYLRTQDLLKITKRSTREAVATIFPQADLTSRKAYLNQSIDAILQGQV